MTRLASRAALVLALPLIALAAVAQPAPRRAADRAAPDLAARITALPGFGLYSTSHLLKLLGRFEQVGIDAVMRRYFGDMTSQDDATDRDIEAHYARFGRCKGLVAFWEVSRRADEQGDLKF